MFGWVNEKVEEFFFGLAEEKSERMEKIVYIITHISLLKKNHIKKRKQPTNQKIKKQSPFMPSLKKKKKKWKESKPPKKEKKRKEKANNQQKQVIMPGSKINK